MPVIVSLLSALRSFLNDGTRRLLLAIGLFLFAAALCAPLQRKGDASEYVLATESLRYDHDLVFDNDVDLRLHAMRRPVGLLDTPNGLTTFEGKDGRVRFGLHSFYYPLIAVPFYAAFGYRGFYLLNALAVFVTIAAAFAYHARREPRPRALLFAAGSVFLSAAWSYVFFMQTEAVYAALISLYLYFWFTERPRAAAGFAGVMAGAQMPLAVLTVPFFVELARKRRFRDAIACALIVALGVAPQVVYNLVRLGFLFPMNAEGLASATFVDGGAYLRTLLDPSMGVLWFYPVVAYALVNMRYDVRRVSLLVAGLLVAVAMNTVLNLYSHQVGIRFGNYLFPIFLFGIETLDDKSWKSRAALAFMVVAGAGLAMNPIGNSYDMDVRKKTFLPYQIASVLPFYKDNPEVFRTSSEELSPWVRARGTFPDGWTRGDEVATLLLSGVEPGAIVMKVNTWGIEGKRQRVVLRTYSGARQELSLPPREETTIRVELSPDDIFTYSRTKEQLSYLTIEAQGWTPAWNVEGGQDDRRRLGIRLVDIRRDGDP